VQRLLVAPLLQRERAAAATAAALGGSQGAEAADEGSSVAASDLGGLINPQVGWGVATWVGCWGVHGPVLLWWCTQPARPLPGPCQQGHALAP